MTERLYYRDAYLREFSAQVTGVAPDTSGVLIRLDRTAFYPTSGGQPHDRGTLGGCPVVDVVEQNGDVVHRVDSPDGSPPSRGAVVEGASTGLAASI